MIEAVMIWNEPNNKSHWDFELDPGWAIFADMATRAGAAVRAESRAVTRVLGGISPIDPGFIANLRRRGVLDAVDAVAVHGFPLDWNHWPIDAWPARIQEIRDVVADLPRPVSHGARANRSGAGAEHEAPTGAGSGLPVWISEVGVSSFGADEVQDWGLERSAALLIGRAPRIHWYSLYDLPAAWPATTRHREAEGSSYYRHFHMGLLREDGSPKPALRRFATHTPALGLCQWFHFEDPRLDAAVRWMKELGVRHLRTGLSWADWFRPGALAWFDRQMRALEPFELTLTFCFTPEHLGRAPHHTSPPVDPRRYADFCAQMTRRYAT